MDTRAKTAVSAILRTGLKRLGCVRSVFVRRQDLAIKNVDIVETERKNDLWQSEGENTWRFTSSTLQLEGFEAKASLYNILHTPIYAPQPEFYLRIIHTRWTT